MERTFVVEIIIERVVGLQIIPDLGSRATGRGGHTNWQVDCCGAYCWYTACFLEQCCDSDDGLQMKFHCAVYSGEDVVIE